MTAFYDQTVPFLINGIAGMQKFLKKAEAHIDEKKFDKGVVLATRIFPDMLNLTKQIQLVSDFGKGASARLQGIAVPSFPDEEKTFDELQARLAKTIDLLKAVDAKLVDPAREVVIKVGGKDTPMSALAYFNGYVLPNFYFHMTTAYNILRGMGVPLGKADFMGRG
ncbi:MAG: DUF1993 domain-containing protein [Alphaproteobacteria bacterium]|nr:DUF1993 domain-containing protein [Alphaproteobacteria bacterium]